MKIEEHIKYWLDSASNDLDAAKSLFSSEKYFYEIEEFALWLKSQIQ